MRRQKMIIFIGIPVLVLIIVLIFIDSWIERGLEKSGEALVGAKVEMDGFHISLFNGSTEWKRLQVTNPKNTMKNLFETGPVRFQLNPSALFKKRLLIQELSILNVAAGTHRSTDGALPARQHREVEKRKPTLFSKMKKRLVQDIESMPVLEWSNLTSTNLNVDSLVQAANLQVIPQVDSAQSQVQRISQKWESFSKTYRPNQDLKKLSETYQAIEIKKINSLPELIDLLQTVQTSSTELKAIQDTIQTKSREMQSDIHTIDRIRKNLPLWIESDYQHLLAKAKLPDLSPKNMGKILFGSAILKRVGFLLDILDLAERALPRKKPSHQKKIEISQQKKNKQNAPAFLIENLALSGRLPIHADTSYLTVKGEGTNLTTQPWIHKKATRLNLKGDDPTGQSVKLAAILNWIEDQNQDSLFIQLKKFPVQFR